MPGRGLRRRATDPGDTRGQQPAHAGRVTSVVTVVPQRDGRAAGSTRRRARAAEGAAHPDEGPGAVTTPAPEAADVEVREALVAPGGAPDPAPGGPARSRRAAQPSRRRRRRASARHAQTAPGEAAAETSRETSADTSGETTAPPPVPPRTGAAASRRRTSSRRVENTTSDPTTSDPTTSGATTSDVGPSAAGPPSGTAAARRRSSPRRPALVAVATLAVTGLVVGAAQVVDEQQAADGVAVPVVAPPEQQTVLVALRGATGTAAVNALLATGGEVAPAAAVLLPERVLAEVPGVGRVPLGDAGPLRDDSALPTAVADLLGVDVDGAWTLEAAELARLVDAVGGVTVDVDEAVLQARPDGTSTVVVGAGPAQVLDGERAVRWLVEPGSADATLARLPRFQRVLEAVLADLPTDAEARADVLGGVGRTVGVDAAGLQEVLGDAGAALRRDAWTADVLPVLPVEAGGALPVWRVDADAADLLVASRLAGSVPDGAVDDARVLVMNGVGTPGLGDRARDRLVPAGFDYAGSRNAVRADGRQFGYVESQVLVRSAEQSDVRLGQEAARALGLPDSAVKVSATRTTVADLVVVLGEDFQA